MLKIHVLDASDKMSSPPICAVLLELPDAGHVAGESLCVLVRAIGQHSEHEKCGAMCSLLCH